MGLFVGDPLPTILNPPGLFKNHSRPIVNHSRIYIYIYIIYIFIYLFIFKALKQFIHNNSRHCLNHKDRCRKKPARSMMNQRQNMFQLYVIQLKVYNMVIYYLIFISSLQTRINKALSPLCSCQTEGMEQRQLFIKGRSCFCCMASNMRCVRAFLYRAFKAQRIDMFAAKMRDSLLTLPLLHTASCAMQKNIAGFEALKQLENPNV